MVAHIHRAAAEQVQREVRDALGFPDLPVLDVMVRHGLWVLIDDDQPAASESSWGVA